MEDTLQESINLKDALIEESEQYAEYSDNPDIQKAYAWGLSLGQQIIQEFKGNLTLTEELRAYKTLYYRLFDMKLNSSEEDRIRSSNLSLREFLRRIAHKFGYNLTALAKYLSCYDSKSSLNDLDFRYWGSLFMPIEWNLKVEEL